MLSSFQSAWFFQSRIELSYRAAQLLFVSDVIISFYISRLLVKILHFRWCRSSLFRYWTHWPLFASRRHASHFRIVAELLWWRDYIGQYFRLMPHTPHISSSASFSLPRLASQKYCFDIIFLYGHFYYISKWYLPRLSCWLLFWCLLLRLHLRFLAAAISLCLLVAYASHFVTHAMAGNLTFFTPTRYMCQYSI